MQWWRITHAAPVNPRKCGCHVTCNADSKGRLADAADPKQSHQTALFVEYPASNGFDLVDAPEKTKHVRSIYPVHQSCQAGTRNCGGGSNGGGAGLIRLGGRSLPGHKVSEPGSVSMRTEAEQRLYSCG